MVGLGMGRNRAGMIKETAGAELKIVIDLNEALAAEAAEELGCDWSSNLDDALGRPDVDAVMIVTPSGTHAELGIKVVEAGKHLIVTKPMDVSVEACDRLIAAGETAGVKIGVDYQSRYVDENVRVASALKDGCLGKPILGEVALQMVSLGRIFRARGRLARHLEDGWRWLAGEPGSSSG